MTLGHCPIKLYAVAVASTNLRADLPRLYQNAGYSKAELKAIEQFNGKGMLAAIQGLVVTVVGLGYLVWVRKYYFRAKED